MSKFLELCKVFTESKEHFQKYEFEAQDLGYHVLNTLIEYYEVPASQVAIYGYDHYGQFDMVNPPLLQAMRLRADGYFEFGVGLTLYESITSEFYQTVIMPIHIAIDADGNKKIRLGEDAKPRTLKDDGSKEVLHAFLDEMYESICNNYRMSLTNLRAMNTLRPIGFKKTENEQST